MRKLEKSSYTFWKEKDETKLKTFKQNALKEAKLFDIHHIIPKYEALYRKYCRTGDC
jgi:hypothetical protein